MLVFWYSPGHNEEVRMDAKRYTAVEIIRAYERRPIELLISSTNTPASAYPMCAVQDN
jgi:hypothetical protein